MTQNRALSEELLRLNKSFAMWVSPLEIAAENWEYERLWLSFISDLKYVGETRYRSSYHKIICTVQLWQNVFKTGNLPFRRKGHFCQSPKSGGVRSFLIKTRGKANTFFWKKNQNSPALPPPPKKKRTFPYNIRIRISATCCSKNPINYLHSYFVFSKYSTTFRLQWNNLVYDPSYVRRR